MKNCILPAVLCLLGFNVNAQFPFRQDTIHSDILGEDRILNIYIPQDISANQEKDTIIYYDVIYLLDGALDEDFIHVSGLVQFANFSWVNYLRPCIVVGIANTDRVRDFTFPTQIEDKKDFPTSGGSAQFIRFLEEELQPYIKTQFPLQYETTLIGQSLGGLLATQVLLNRSYMFNNYVIVSPSLWWDNESLLNTTGLLTQVPKRIYIGVGDEEEEVMKNDAEKLYNLLQTQSNGMDDIRFRKLELANHANILHPILMEFFRIWSARSARD